MVRHGDGLESGAEADDPRGEGYASIVTDHDPTTESETSAPLTPRDRGWWSAFGEALLTGEFEESVDPEVTAFVDDCRRRLVDTAGAAVSAIPSDRLDAIADRLTGVEDRLARIEGRLDDDQRTTPTA